MIQPVEFSRKQVIFASLAMFYVTLVLCSAVLTHKVVQIGPAITLGGVLIVPPIYTLADIMTEIYGYKSTNVVLQVAFAAQLIFALICHFSIQLGSPSFWHGASSYQFVFSPLMKMSFASYFAYTVSSMLNTYVISKWRVLWKGRLFWIRSIGSSTLGEMVYSIAIILFMHYKYSSDVLFNMAITSYSIKIIFAVIFAFPASGIVFMIRCYLKNDKTSRGPYEPINPFSK